MFRKIIMLKNFAAVVMAAVVAVYATPSFSQTIEIGPGGVRLVDPDRDRPPPPPPSMGISRRQAVQIARHEGLRDVDNIDRGRDRFIIEGTDRDDNDIAVTIDRQTGEVISVE